MNFLNFSKIGFAHKINTKLNIRRRNDSIKVLLMCMWSNLVRIELYFDLSSDKKLSHQGSRCVSYLLL